MDLTHLPAQTRENVGMGFVNLLSLASNILNKESELAGTDFDKLAPICDVFEELSEILLLADTPKFDALMEKVGYKYEY